MKTGEERDKIEVLESLFVHMITGEYLERYDEELDIPLEVVASDNLNFDILITDDRFDNEKESTSLRIDLYGGIIWNRDRLVECLNDAFDTVEKFAQAG